ncbi:MAG: hypothetical protein HYX53_05305 [Chloroflexi bacterium]|nr:hypothetical protein [Chloroflexota bacterium]
MDPRSFAAHHYDPHRFHGLRATLRADLGLLAVALLALTLVGFLPRASAAPTTTTTLAANPTACNGDAVLCDRRYDQVVYPATHNSMSAEDQGWLWPFQESGITQQLNDGIRMLLIDTHYWETNDNTAPYEKRAGPALAPDVAAAAANAGPPESGPLLCHAECWMGHTPLVAGLAEIRDFLVSRPAEVVSIFIQDAITTRDTVAAFQAAGLEPFLYTYAEGAPWPTLREMIRSNQRLVVFAEVQGPPPAWYQQGWTLIQDTGFDVTNPSGFTCALNRGRGSNPLFLLNNWIAALVPRQSDAAIVNSRVFLLERARKCMSERGRLPNFIAVNFYETGDLFQVVDELNGVAPRTLVAQPR